MKNDKLPVGAVFAVITAPNGKILLIQDNNKPAPHYWKLPGGKVDWREDKTPEEALLREIKEEIGFFFCLFSLKKICEAEKNKNSRPHKILFFRVLEDVGEEKIKKGREIEKNSLFSRSQIEKMIVSGEILSSHAEALSVWMAENPF